MLGKGRRGLSHPNACQTEGLAQAGAGLPVACPCICPQIPGAGNTVEDPTLGHSGGTVGEKDSSSPVGVEWAENEKEVSNSTEGTEVIP